MDLLNKFQSSRFFYFVKTHNFLVLLALLIFMSLALYRHYVFGGRLFLFEDFGSDSVRVSLPTYVYLFDWFKNGMPLWSDKMGIGTSVLSHGDIIFDPFTYILFIFGKSKIIYMFVYMVIAKIIFSGIFFGTFLGKYSNYKLSSYSKIIGALTYAFGGYMIVTGQNYVFGTIYVYLPLILLGFEIWFHDKKSWLLILMLTLTALYFYYFFYMTAIFFAAYAIFRYSTLYSFKLKHFLSYTFSLAGYGLLSLGLSAFYWLPSLALTLSNLRVGSSIPNFGKLFLPEFRAVITVLGRLFGYDIFGSPKIYTGFNVDYFQLALFCGVITLVLVPQIFCEKDKRKRFAYGIFSTVLAVFLFIPFFAYVFNVFSDFTYRWIYVLHFSLALFLAIAVENVFRKMKLNYKILFGTFGGLFLISLIVMFIMGLMGVYLDFSFRTESSASKGLIAISQLYQHGQIFKETLLISFRTFLKDYMLLIAYVLLIVMFFRTRYKRIMKILVLLLICFELVWFPSHFIDNRLTTSPDPVKNHLGYFDNTNNAVSYLNALDSSIYRLDKSYDSVKSEYGLISSDNDAMVQNYRGLKSYNGNNQPNYIRFLQYSGIFVKYPDPKWIKPEGVKPEDFKDANLNYINGVGNRYLLQSFLGVKYYLTKAPTSLPYYYRYLTKINDIFIYKNENYLPLGFTFDSYISEIEFKRLNNSQKDVVLLSSVVTDDKKLSESLTKNDKSKLNEFIVGKNIDSLINKRRSNYLKIISYKPDNITGKISVPKNEVLVLTIPYDQGWELSVDGKRDKLFKVDVGLIGIRLNPGSHIVKLKYFPSNMMLGIVITIVTIFLFVIFNRKNFIKISAKINRLSLDSMYFAKKSFINDLFNRLKNKKYFFYSTTVLGIMIFFIQGIITRGYSFYNFFSRDISNYFMDFYNTLATLIIGPYDNGSIYPPLPLLMYKILLRFIPYDIVEKGSFAIRATQTGQIVFLAYTLITLMVFFALIIEAKKGTRLEKYIFILVTLFSAPFLFQFERANIIFVALLFSMTFIFFKDSKNHIIREFALVSLAVSSAIKIYPVLFGLLLIKDRRYKDFFKICIYGLALFILPFFFISGINQLHNLINNFSYASRATTEWGLGYAVNTQNLVRIIAAFFGDFSHGSILLGRILSIIIFVLGIVGAIFIRSKWKTITLLTLLMILVPPISYEYTLVFMIIPLILFLDSKEKKNRFDYIYLICFVLIFIPLNIGKIDLINKGFGIDVPLPLSYGVLIQNIALTIMFFTLLIQTLKTKLRA